VPTKFQLLHRAVKGTPIVSLNTVTHAVQIRLLARQIHNALFSPPPPPVAPLAFAALSPPQPCSSPAPPLPAWRRWRGRGYWRADVSPANLRRLTRIHRRRPRPRRRAGRPPQATSRCGSSPSDHHENNYFIHDRGLSCLNPQRPLSHWPPKSICYIFMSMWIN
jgi:hypothetical protein